MLIGSLLEGAFLDSPPFACPGCLFWILLSKGYVRDTFLVFSAQSE